VFQSTLPVKGATKSPLDDEPQLAVSIHAPSEGSDKRKPRICGTPGTFQSTLPVKGATWRLDGETTVCQFQSTLPVKGATPVGAGIGMNDDVSIHAPSEGSDLGLVHGRVCALGFNPRSQ